MVQYRCTVSVALNAFLAGNDILNLGDYKFDDLTNGEGYQNITDTPRNFMLTQDGDTQNRIGSVKQDETRAVSPSGVTKTRRMSSRGSSPTRRVAQAPKAILPSVASDVWINRPTSHG